MIIYIIQFPVLAELTGNKEKCIYIHIYNILIHIPNGIEYGVQEFDVEVES